MAYVITDSCIKDSLCVEVCPTDCIHPKTDEPGYEEATQMYVDPEGCIDCGAKAGTHAPPTQFTPSKMCQDDKKEFVEKNAAFYKK